MKENEITVVTMGDSITWGYCATDKSLCFADLFCEALKRYSGKTVRLVNSGIGANVLTSLCPSYEYSQKPCGEDRISEDCIAHNPDVVVFGFGTNDCRSGLDKETFCRRYADVIMRVQRETESTVIVTSLFYMPDIMLRKVKHFERASRRDVEEYNEAIKRMCDGCGAVFADVYSAMKGCDHLVDGDKTHPNDIGHRVIADSVFAAFARNEEACNRFLKLPTQSQVYAFMDRYGNGQSLKI